MHKHADSIPLWVVLTAGVTIVCCCRAGASRVVPVVGHQLHSTPIYTQQQMMGVRVLLISSIKLNTEALLHKPLKETHKEKDSPWYTLTDTHSIHTSCIRYRLTYTRSQTDTHSNKHTH